MADSYRFYDDVPVGFQPSTPGNPDKDISYVPGETAGSQCEDVIFYPSNDMGRHRLGFKGRIYCTNVRLCFVPYAKGEKRSLPRRFVPFNDQLDVPLVSVHKIFVSEPSSSHGLVDVEQLKFREMTSSVSSMDIVYVLRLILRDLRVVVVDLSESQNAANVANHVLHFSRPSSPLHIPQCGQLPGQGGRVLYSDAFDWENEIKRCRLGRQDKWRVAGLVSEELRQPVYSVPNAAATVHAVPSYPMHVVVCAELVKADMDRMIPLWRGGRFPIWVWSHHNGASLLRSAFPENNENAEKEQQSLWQLIGRASPQRDVHEIRVPPEYGPARIAKSFDALRRLCTIDSATVFSGAEEDWAGLVNDSQWPRLVNFCMKMAAEALHHIHQLGQTVIVVEEDGRDLSAIICSLVELCLREECRRDIGQFLLLIAKEFCALGHPFGDRSLSPHGTTPTFLLFLDAVHQLFNQAPNEFGFSPHLLLALWDASISGFLPPFTCNSAVEQNEFGGASALCPSDPAGCLRRLFTDEYRTLFRNVRFEAAYFLGKQTNTSYLLPWDRPLRPRPSPVHYRFWTGFFLRWNPAASIEGGGQLAADRRLDEVMAELYGNKWTRIFGELDGQKASTSSSYPYTGIETDHISRYERANDDDSDTRSLSALSISGITKRVPSDDARSLRSKLSIKMPRIAKKFHSPTPKHKKSTQHPEESPG